MPFRFQRSIKILPGLKLNVSKSGISASAGVPGAHITLGRRGARGTVGLPGSGASYSEDIAKPGQELSWGRVAVVLAVVAVVGYAVNVWLK